MVSFVPVMMVMSTTASEFVEVVFLVLYALPPFFFLRVGHLQTIPPGVIQGGRHRL